MQEPTVAQKSKARKQQKGLKKSKKMEEVKPLLFGSVATGKHIAKGIITVNKA